MTASTFTLLIDILTLLFMIIGALWMWGVFKFKAEVQQRFEEIFARSRKRFKWMFLIGAILLAALFVRDYFL